MCYDVIKSTYFNALRRARAAKERFDKNFPNGLDLSNPTSIKMFIDVESTYGGVAALMKIVIPAKDVVFTKGILTEISDEYDNATTEEEEDRALKRFYDLYEVRKDDID